MDDGMNDAVLVTGANGYIGAHVVKTLLERCGCHVVAVDFSNSYLPEYCGFKNIDILERCSDPQLYEELGRPAAIIHLAWKDGFRHNSNAHLENLYRHYEFIVNMHKAGCENITVMGSMHEVGYYEGAIDDENPPPCNPLSLYGIAKNSLRQALDVYSRGSGLKLKWLRGYYITGDEERASSVFGKILKLSREGIASMPFTDGKNQYDFIDINDLAFQISCAALQTDIAGIINMGSGRPQALKDVVTAFIEHRKLGIQLEYGAFPSRAYDSPCVYGNTRRINNIVKNYMEANNEKI